MSLNKYLSKLLIAPNNLKKDLLNKIKNEASNAEKGLPARIFAMNSLEDPDIINELYMKHLNRDKNKTLWFEVSCCLRPGVKNLSENIEVISVLGQFLEHSRVYYFACGNEDFLDGEVFIGSADWMVQT